MKQEEMIEALINKNLEWRDSPEGYYAFSVEIDNGMTKCIMFILNGKELTVSINAYSEKHILTKKMEAKLTNHVLSRAEYINKPYRESMERWLRGGTL